MSSSWLLGPALLAVVAAVVPMQETIELSEDEKEAVRRILSDAPSFRVAAGPEDETKIYLTSMWAYEAKAEPEADEPTRLVEVSHFRYDGGITIRSIIDLSDERIMKVESLEAYPTPLAPEELERAVGLSREELNQVRALYRERGKEAIEVEPLVTVVADRRDPEYGHRIAILVFTSPGPPVRSARARVDLTEGMVEDLNPERSAPRDARGDDR